MHNSKSPKTPQKSFLEYIKNIGRRKHQRGLATVHEGGGAPPTSWATWQAPDVVFCPEKNDKEAFGTKCRRLEAEPGRKQYRAPVELFCQGNIPPRGGNRRHRHHHRSFHRERVNLHQHLHQHHLLSNPSSSLASDLCLKTSDWYLWVASSVDYSL